MVLIDPGGDLLLRKVRGNFDEVQQQFLTVIAGILPGGTPIVKGDSNFRGIRPENPGMQIHFSVFAYTQLLAVFMQRETFADQCAAFQNSPECVDLSGGFFGKNIFFIRHGKTQGIEFAFCKTFHGLSEGVRG